MLFTADFETTTNPDDCRVWAWGINSIDDSEFFHYGNTIDSFFDYVQSEENSTYYFHNLKFDGEFIFQWLFKNGFTHSTDRRENRPKTFTTLISDTGQFYSIKVNFRKEQGRNRFARFYDSLKILPFSVDRIAKGFDLPISKLSIDYDAHREVGHILTFEEIAYLKNDVKIVAEALNILFNQGLTKITQGSNALHNYKTTVGVKSFDNWFPVPDYDEDVRQSYKGGFTYLSPKYRNKDIGRGIVLDINSLYPWAMYYCDLPYGDGIHFDGEYDYGTMSEGGLYPLYVQMFTCQFKLKDNHIPTVQLKNNLSFVPTEYLESSNDKFVTMCMTSVDLELFKEHYEINNIEYHSGWKFKCSNGLFRQYIDYWMNVKIQASIDGNEAMRTLAKLMLNALYGKFALNPKVASKIPYYEDGIVKYYTPKEEYTDSKGKKRKRTKYEDREPIYIPVGTFITAYARAKTIRSAQSVYDNFIYADTDSLHLDIELPKELAEMSNKELSKLSSKELSAMGLNLPFHVHPNDLGAWKLEERFDRARYIRQKSYIHDLDGELSITCAGMPERCYQYVTFDNFKEGSTFKGKLQPKHVKGGIVLVDTEFTIQKSL